jgi:hypothetical protein
VQHKNIVYEKHKADVIAAQRRLIGDHYLAGGTTESDHDTHIMPLGAQQHPYL